jgi:hypothetical protein
MPTKSKLTQKIDVRRSCGVLRHRRIGAKSAIEVGLVIVLATAIAGMLDMLSGARWKPPAIFFSALLRPALA